MKRMLIAGASLLAATAAAAQPAGRFETHDLGSFKLHVYYTDDALGDVSYIVEGEDALVTLEQPLFRENVAEFDAYLSALGKPVQTRIADYHVGGTGDQDVVMAEGMPEYTKGEVYTGMMTGFEQAFGEALAPAPTGRTSEAAFGSTHTWAGVTFEFRPGAASDFPGASLLIGGKVYYTHWAPAKAHVSHLQVSTPAAIDAEIAEAGNSLASGAELFIGGHGNVAGRDAVEFKIAYLNKMKEAFAGNESAQAFAEAMDRAYPGLPGAEGLEDLGKALYR
ncbi:hypothetical protein [uncultured Alistipes sp.]|uniref:hypothetical protein n=1 Tax=uncultured Alistipes sp. TaxID=538949 RepID=UPI00345D19D5